MSRFVAGRITAVALVLYVVFPAPAQAYVDPVSGSILLQVLAAGVLAAAFTFKQVTHRIRSTARRIWAQIRRR
jgi:succinate dehydrogenase hydrophobic anchor subunit